MKKILAFLFTALFVSCSENTPKVSKEEIKNAEIIFDTLTIGKKVYQMQDLQDTNFVFEKFDSYDPSDSAYIAKNKDVVSRTGDTLFLKCDNGRIVKIKSNRDEGDYEVYEFKYLNKEINTFVIMCSFYESSSIWLVNKTNGDSLETVGFPIVSPNKKQFICANTDLEAGFSGNGIELFGYDNKTIASKGFRELFNWGPEKVTWKNDTTLIVVVMERDGENGLRQF